MINQMFSCQSFFLQLQFANFSFSTNFCNLNSKGKKGHKCKYKIRPLVLMSLTLKQQPYSSTEFPLLYLTIAPHLPEALPPCNKICRKTSWVSQAQFQMIFNAVYHLQVLTFDHYPLTTTTTTSAAVTNTTAPTTTTATAATITTTTAARFFNLYTLSSQSDPFFAWSYY